MIIEIISYFNTAYQLFVCSRLNIMIIEIFSYFDTGYQIVGVEKVVCQTSGQVLLRLIQ